MDAWINRMQQGTGRIRTAGLLAALFCFGVSSAEAQRADTAPEKPGEVIAYSSGGNAAVALPPVSWRIQNSAFANGCLVIWQAEPFALQGKPAIKADCDLSVMLEAGTPVAEWKAVTPHASTLLSKGKNRAVVEVASARRGNARVLIQVQLIPQNQHPLAAGRYSTTVTGTVTGL
ncbi:MAG: hypothetical protein R3C49_07995 [Planctomycetaceae bacterium]